MAAIERMTITVPTEMAAALKATVAEGQYASTSEVVREALREWTRARDTERRELEALRQAIRVGDDSGPSIPAADVYAELRRLVASRRRACVKPLGFAPEALADLRDIALHIANDDPQRALTFVGALASEAAKAAARPLSFASARRSRPVCGGSGMAAT